MEKNNGFNTLKFSNRFYFCCAYRLLSHFDKNNGLFFFYFNENIKDT